MNVKFNSPTGDRLYADLTQRVNQYFKSNNIKKTANVEMVSKTVILLIAYWLPYVLLMTVSMPLWVAAIMCALLGITMAGIGMSIMHDAAHGAYSKNKFINKALAYTANMVGASKYNWVIQHNVKHHTYTNVHGLDEDIDNGGIVRLSPFTPWKWFHKFQHIYGWLLYSLNTLVWVTTKDFKGIVRYKKDDYIKTKSEYIREYIIMVITKVVYYSYIVVLPILFTPFTVVQVLIGFFIIHAFAGFILAVTFQLAHVVEDKHFETAFNGDIDNSWAAHQVVTTANFGMKSRLLNWYIGGLNFQIEHHLFPHICHVHYRKISEIVKNTVKEYGLEYHDHKYMFSAIISHYKTLREFSKNPVFSNN